MNGDLSIGSINGSGFAPTNLVINPEFTINQRGAATRTTTSSAYNFDRWYYDGTNLLQGVENNNLRATTYVISWEGSSTCAYSLNTAAASGQGSESYTSVTNGGTITIASVGSNTLWLKFTSDLDNLNKVMLVQGTEQSVFVARPYGTELSLCQRYYQKLLASGAGDLFGSGFFQSTTSSRFFVPFLQQMRSAPSALETSGTAGDYSMFSNATFIATSVPAFAAASNFSMNITCATSGATTMYPALFRAVNSSAYLAWSAEL